MKKTITVFAVLAAFIFQLWKGFSPPVPQPGDMMSGAMNDPLSVIFSGLLAAAAVWAVIEILFWVYRQLRR